MKEKVLIQTSDYFTIKSWEYSLNNRFPDYNKFFTLSFVSRKDEIEKLLVEAYACFIFNYFEVLNLNKSKLKLIYFGISDLDYMENYNFPETVKIYSSKGIASKLIAEYSLMASLILIRNFQSAIISKLDKKWYQEPFLIQKNVSIRNYKIGVLGLGNNGKAIVEIFKSIGCWVGGYSKSEKKNLNLDHWSSSNKLNEILEMCDIIIVSLPLRNDTKNLIGLDQFRKMGSDSFLVNVSRGNIIIENDLIFALNEKIIKGAAIDVCSVEPLPKKSKLWKVENLLITPHISGNINYFVNNIQVDFVNKLKSLKEAITF